jgi:hypothetical protein
LRARFGVDHDRHIVAADPPPWAADAAGNRTKEEVFDPSNALTALHHRAYNTLNQLWKDSAESERLRAALEAFSQAVRENGEIGNEPREQVLDLARDAITAAGSAKPNAPKIAGLLGGISNVVRTVASLRPAYEALRDVALAIGFFLQ